MLRNGLPPFPLRSEKSCDVAAQGGGVDEGGEEEGAGDAMDVAAQGGGVDEGGEEEEAGDAMDVLHGGSA